MSAQFDYFVVFAEMRTGSNLLEANLNALNSVRCHGEAFNPHFIGYPNKTELLGFTQKMRDGDPGRLIAAIRDEPGTLGGFRFFHDHDPRVLEATISDPRCAKIILTRNPLDSYVSWKIARETGQWKLTDARRRKSAAIRFDSAEFTALVAAHQEFQVDLLNRLQRSGQSAFYLGYEDLREVDAINGLAAWLGVESRLDAIDKSLKPQNPGPVLKKVSNPDDMFKALDGIDRFNLTRTPNFEPRRGPAVPGFVLGAETPLVYMPVRGGPEEQVTRWMADLDSVAPGSLGQGLSQKQLRQWMRARPGHRRFTVLRHPLARAHAVFCSRILRNGSGAFLKIRNTLRRQFDLPVPATGPDSAYSRADHRAGFEAFLDFLQLNLSGQTPIRVDACWSSQAQSIAGFCAFAPPDLIVREEEIDPLLPDLARRAGHPGPGRPDPTPQDMPYALADIYDEALEAKAALVYQRDYLMFGFRPWRD